MKSKSTLHDVAAAAGVSIATASKALNGLPVAAHNKHKVAEAAERLGYVVNHTARSLRNRQSYTVGLIFYELSTARGLGLLDSMSEKLESAGYSLICATARSDAKTYDTLMGRFLERRVDGLFCVTPPAELRSVERFRAAGIPIVAITERSAALRSESLVRPSLAAATRDSLADILRFGHRRISSIDDGSNNLTLSSVDTGPIQGIDLKLIRLADVDSLERFLDASLNTASGPTLISAFEAQAEAILSICRASKIGVPGELSIVALTNSSNEKRARDLGLSSLYVQPELLGGNAAAQMLTALSGEKMQDDISVEVGAWNLRQSVGRTNRP